MTPKQEQQLSQFNELTKGWEKQVRLRLKDGVWLCEIFSLDNLQAPFTLRDLRVIIRTLQVSERRYRKSVQLQMHAERKMKEVENVQV